MQKILSFNELRLALRPRGDSPVVKLQLREAFYDQATFGYLIDHLERKFRPGPHITEPPDPADLILMQVLQDSAAAALEKTVVQGPWPPVDPDPKN